VRIVLDTNILISALITTGTPPDLLYRDWIDRRFELITSNAQMTELAAVLRRPRLQKHIDAAAAAAIVSTIDTRALLIEELPDVELSPDPKDNPILATAIAGKADLVVSGDKKHLLALNHVENIPIVTARDALDRLKST